MSTSTAHAIQRRHSRWWEACLISEAAQLLAGSILVCIVPGMLLWGVDFWRSLQPPQTVAIVAVLISLWISAFTQRRLGSFPGTSYLANAFPIVAIVFLITFAAILFLRIEYSRPLLLLGGAVTLVWCLLCAVIAHRFLRLKVAILPVGQPAALESTPQIEIRALTRPDTEGVRYDAVVADLNSGTIGGIWERFLADCALAKIPVYTTRRMEEAITGRVSVNTLTANEAGSLQPSPLYAVCKRLIDIVACLLMLPIALPLIALTAIAIRLDSPGAAIFVQQRVGLGNKTFSVYKMRSMRTDAERAGAKMATASDARITRVGHFIRKVRLDELPQLFNVLKGDMSLIGPRPEQRVFVDRFDESIPFYRYRHVVRPGVTGWAQVMQGYASNADETRVKIQYDLYYIKHFSLWLDALIVLKTIKTVFTGHGAL